MFLCGLASQPACTCLRTIPVAKTQWSESPLELSAPAASSLVMAFAVPSRSAHDNAVSPITDSVLGSAPRAITLSKKVAFVIAILHRAITLYLTCRRPATCLRIDGMTPPINSRLISHPRSTISRTNSVSSEAAVAFATSQPTSLCLSRDGTRGCCE